MSDRRYIVPDGDRAAVGCWRVIDQKGEREVCRHWKRSQARNCAAERNAHADACTGFDIVTPPPGEPVQLPLPEGEAAKLQERVKELEAERDRLIAEVNHFEAKVTRLEDVRDRYEGYIRRIGKALGCSPSAGVDEIEREGRRRLEAAAARADRAVEDYDALADDRRVVEVLQARIDALKAIIREQGGELAVLRAEAANDDRAAG